jgi:N-methylhydantoinase A/oxoprolinase/acetone carboxylase beta subunit
MSYGIGIDTGGTFTDAVLVNLETNKVEAFAKVPTTHYDLKEGIEKSLEKLFSETDVSKSDISKVGVSSTLATNAVVENKGGDVALFIIGIEDHLEVPAAGFKFIEGGHDIKGNEVMKLDIESIVSGVEFFRGNVDSYAVVSAMSFANSSHELVAKKAINMVDPKPVYVSSEVSSVPGIEERATTTVLNARLMPVMDNFINGLKQSILKYIKEDALKIINGEGGFLNFEDAVKKSVLTFGSGPASTAYYGAVNAKNAVVIDIGGTTTDILLVEDFAPVTDSRSKIGTYETHVKSVRMKTIGLGGDSRVGFDNRNNITVGTDRVEPLCFSEDVPSPGSWLDLPVQDSVFYMRNNPPSDPRSFCEIFKEKKYPGMNDFYKSAGKGERTKETVKDFVKKGFFGALGFTPTDALAVLGKIDAPYIEKSVEAAKILSEYNNTDYKEFCAYIIQRVENCIAEAVIDFLARYSSGKSINDVFPDWKNNKYLDIRFSSKFPVIGSGAAAKYFLEGVSQKLGAELILPEYYEIGNALGALKIVIDK